MTTSTKPSSIDQFDFLSGDDLTSGGTSAELPQASTVQSDAFSDGNLDQLGVSSANNNQSDLFGEDFAGNTNPTTTTTLTTEQTDLFGGENLNNELSSAPPPAVQQYDAFDDLGANDPIVTESATKDANKEVPVASSQSDAFNYDAFNEQSAPPAEVSNAPNDDLFGARNSQSKVTFQDDIVEYHAELNESPSSPPAKANEILATNSEIG